jgi:hypothetical protein
MLRLRLPMQRRTARSTLLRRSTAAPQVMPMLVTPPPMPQCLAAQMAFGIVVNVALTAEEQHVPPVRHRPRPKDVVVAMA